MTNMGDALHRAGLINEKDLKRQAHRDRVRRKSAGPENAPRPRPDHDHLVHPRKRGQGIEDAAIEKAADLVRTHAIAEGLSGRRRWHYVSTDGRILYLNVTESVANLLETGDRAIAWDGSKSHVVDRDIARQIADIDPATVLFWNDS